MADKYVIEIQGAHRVERSLLDDERRLARELREATRETRALLLEAARDAAPRPRKGTNEEQGDGVGATINFPGATGGLRRLAGRAPGGAPLVALTYEVNLFVEAGTLAGYREEGTGLFGPLGSKYPIYPSGSKALLLTGGAIGIQTLWGGNQGATPFRGGAGEKLPIFDHVLHPGVKARPFLEKTVRDHAPEVDRIYDHAVDSAIRGV